MKFRVGKRRAGDHAADGGALQSLLLHRRFQLLHREVGRLQGEGRKGGEAVGMGRAELGQLLVLHLDDLTGELAVAAVPEGIDRQHFHVDGLSIHRLQPLIDVDDDFIGAVDLRQNGFGAVIAEQRAGFLDQAVGVNVDGLDPLAVDHDRQFLARRCLRMRALQNAAAAKGDAGGGADPCFEEITASCHRRSLPGLLLLDAG